MEVQIFKKKFLSVHIDARPSSAFSFNNETE